jgi:molybdate transport system permease protein
VRRSGEATAARLALVSFTLAISGLLLAEWIARRMHLWLGRG